MIKSEKKKDEIQGYMRGLVKKLNKRHRLFLEKACTDERKFHNVVLNSILRIESFFLWGVPIYVLPQSEFDLVKKKVMTPKLWILVTFIGTLDEFLKSLKDTAVVVYGEDLLGDIRDVEFSVFDKVKLTFQPYYLLFLATLIAPFNAKFSLKHAIKATVLESESDLMWLHEKLGSYRHDEKLYGRLFKGHEFEIKHLRKTIGIRMNMHKLNLTKGEALDYLLNCYRFVWSSHAALMSK